MVGNHNAHYDGVFRSRCGSITSDAYWNWHCEPGRYSLYRWILHGDSHWYQWLSLSHISDVDCECYAVDATRNDLGLGPSDLLHPCGSLAGSRRGQRSLCSIAPTKEQVSQPGHSVVRLRY